jgi:hypothetical protein
MCLGYVRHVVNSNRHHRRVACASRCVGSASAVYRWIEWCFCTVQGPPFHKGSSKLVYYQCPLQHNSEIYPERHATGREEIPRRADAMAWYGPALGKGSKQSGY